MADDRIEANIACHGPWRHQSLGEETVKAAFRRMRERLAAAGCQFDHALPDLPPVHPVDYSSSEEDGCASSGEEEGEYNGPKGWALVERLGWRLRCDDVFDDIGMREAIANLGGGRAALREFLHAREAELAADPYLATKSRALRLQFAALGQEWFAAVQESPTLADYLEGQTQDIDLEAALG